MRRSIGSLIAALALLPVAGASAQKPGDELPTYERIHYQYLAETLGQVKEILTSWRELQTKGNVKELSKLFTDDALFSPVDGWYVQGRNDIADSLTARLPHQSGYYTSIIDFSASSGLAYCLGKVRYVVNGGAGEPRSVAGTFSMVLYLDGRRWRIRSYLERSEL